MEKVKVIVNPASGKGRGGKSVPVIRQKLLDLDLNFDLVLTEHQGHAIALAQQAVNDGFDTVIAAGGDGTANEVINGLMLVKQFTGKTAALGVLCVGRGNDFAFGAGIPQDLNSGIDCVMQNHRKMIDIGRVLVDSGPAPRFFGNGIGIGFDAVVGFEACKLKLTGFPAYAVAALKTIFLYDKAPVIRLDIDGEVRDQPSLMVSVMNGRRMGGGFMMAPQADISDGKFSLCIAGDANRRTIFSVIPKFMKGSQEGHPVIEMRLAEKITVTALDAPLPAHADGETLCEKGQKLTIDLLPSQIEVICQTE
ncbi:diacylglycerol kinase family lipid kinase [bacterium]|nr:diacylglycerol kinase family lipid kinase [bacterium]